MRGFRGIARHCANGARLGSVRAATATAPQVAQATARGGGAPAPPRSRFSAQWAPAGGGEVALADPRRAAIVDGLREDIGHLRADVQDALRVVGNRSKDLMEVTNACSQFVAAHSGAEEDEGSAAAMLDDFRHRAPLRVALGVAQVLVARGVRHEPLLNAAAWNVAKFPFDIAPLSPEQRALVAGCTAAMFAAIAEAGLLNDHQLVAVLLSRCAELAPWMSMRAVASAWFGLRWLNRLHFSAAEAMRYTDGPRVAANGALEDPRLVAAQPATLTTPVQLTATALAVKSEEFAAVADEDLNDLDDLDELDSPCAPSPAPAPELTEASFGAGDAEDEADALLAAPERLNLVDVVGDALEARLCVLADATSAGSGEQPPLLRPVDVLRVLEGMCVVGVRDPAALAAVSTSLARTTKNLPLEHAAKALLAAEQVHERVVDVLEASRLERGLGDEVWGPVLADAAAAPSAPMDTGDVAEPPLVSAAGELVAVASAALRHVTPDEARRLARANPSCIVSLRQVCERCPAVLRHAPQLWDAIRGLRLPPSTQPLPQITGLGDAGRLLNGGRLAMAQAGRYGALGSAECRVRKKVTVTDIDKNPLTFVPPQFRPYTSPEARRRERTRRAPRVVQTGFRERKQNLSKTKRKIRGLWTF